MSIPAHVTMESANGARGARRRRIRLAAGRMDTARVALDIVIHDLSAGGCSFVGRHPIAPGARIRLRIPHAGEVSARISWARGGKVGCAFDRPLTPEAVAAALSGSRVIWGDFGQAEAAAPRASGPIGKAGGRRRAGAAVVAIGVVLAAFWIMVAAIV